MCLVVFSKLGWRSHPAERPRLRQAFDKAKRKLASAKRLEAIEPQEKPTGFGLSSTFLQSRLSTTRAPFDPIEAKKNGAGGGAITVVHISGVDKKEVGWADIQFKKQDLIGFLMHDAELTDIGQQ